MNWTCLWAFGGVEIPSIRRLDQRTLCIRDRLKEHLNRVLSSFVTCALGQTPCVGANECCIEERVAHRKS